MFGRVIDERAIGERYSAVRSRLDERAPSRPAALRLPFRRCRSVSTQQLPNIREPLRQQAGRVWRHGHWITIDHVPDTWPIRTVESPSRGLH